MKIKKAKNIALAISVVAFVVGFSDLYENIYFWMGRPVGAIALVTYFIFVLLEKEYAILEEQERCARKTVPTAAAGNRSLQSVSDKGTCTPALATATSP